jgi:hypothetical protein
MTCLRALLILISIAHNLFSKDIFYHIATPIPFEQSMMVSTRQKTEVSSNPVASGRAYKALIGYRKRRRIAVRKIEAWNKSNRSSRSSSRPPLSPSVLEASNWTTPHLLWNLLFPTSLLPYIERTRLQVGCVVGLATQHALILQQEGKSCIPTITSATAATLSTTTSTSSSLDLGPAV